MTGPAMTSPSRLARQSVTIATGRLGDRKAACRVVVQVARAARGHAFLAGEGDDCADLPLIGWLDQVVAEAEALMERHGAR